MPYTLMLVSKAALHWLSIYIMLPYILSWESRTEFSPKHATLSISVSVETTGNALFRPIIVLKNLSHSVVHHCCYLKCGRAFLNDVGGLLERVGGLLLALGSDHLKNGVLAGL